MSRELIGTEYFSNIYYTDINIVKKKKIYEIRYSVFILSDLSVDLRQEDISLKHFIGKSQQINDGLTLGNLSLEDQSYEIFPIKNFNMTIDGNMRKYSHNVSLRIHENDFESLSIFSCLSKKSRRSHYNGAVFSELLINPNKIINTSNFIFEKNGIEYGGPVHQHEDGFMEGSFHSSRQHNEVVLKRLNDSKILFLEDLELQKKNYDRKNTSIVYSFPYVEDYKGKVSFIFAINLIELVLQNSLISRTLYSYNKGLFFNLSNNLIIKNIKIHRETRRKVVSLNRLKVPVESTLEESKSVICDATFKNGVLEKTTRYNLENKNIVNVKASEIDEINKVYKPTQESVAEQDLNGAKIITTLEQIDPSEQDVLFFQFSDFEIPEMAGKEYFYSISVEIEDTNSLYVINKIKEFSSVIDQLSNMVSEIQQRKYYDYNNFQFTEEYLEKFYNSNNIQYDENFLPLDNESEKLKNLVNHRATQIFSECYAMLFDKNYNLQNIYDGLNILKSNPYMINEVKNILLSLLEMLKNNYLQEKNAVQFSRSYDRKGIISKIETNLLLKQTFKIKDSYEKSINQMIGYSYIATEDFDSILSVDNNFLNSRGTLEKNKFLIGEIQQQDQALYNLSNNQKEAFVETTKTRNQYLTPSSIKIGKQRQVIDDFNKKTTNKKFFNILTYSRQANQTKPKMIGTESQFLSSINPFISIMNSPKENTAVSLREEGYYVESRKYLNNISFINLELKFPSNLEQMFINEEVYSKIQKSVASKKIPGSLRLQDFNLQDEKNMFANTNKDFSEIPIQIKSIMASTSQNVKNNFAATNFKDFEDPEAAEIINQIFLNIKKLKAFIGFESVDGIYNLDIPTYMELNYNNFLSLQDKNYICILDDYEISFSKKSNEKDFKIFDNIFRVINRPQILDSQETFLFPDLSFTMNRKRNYSKSIIVSQNVENFGNALRIPINLNPTLVNQELTAPTQSTSPIQITPTQPVTTGGTSNGSY